MSISVGSVVQLKTGSPSMTVQKIEGNVVKVQWFEGTTLKESVFSYNSLQPVLNEQILFG